MEFSKWLSESHETAAELIKQANVDDTDSLAIAADAMEDLGYPNVENFRDAVERLRIAHIQGMNKSVGNKPGNYESVYWEIRRRVIRFLTEAEHWINRSMKNVSWSGPYEK